MNFVFDLDDTLCFKGEPMSNQIVNALQDLTEKGHRIIFASARPIRDMLPVVHPSFHHNLLIGGNGSLIANEKKIIYSQSFDKHDVNFIMNLLNKSEATYLIDGDWDYTYTGSADHPILKNLDPATLGQNVPLEEHDQVIKILVLSANDLASIERSLKQTDAVIHRHGSENVLDISPPHINKRTALQYLGIEKEGYIAFGNDANDIELFKGASHAVMIGEHEQLRAYADSTIYLQDDFETDIANYLMKLEHQYIANSIDNLTLENV